jgi:guanosine-3',5'-bis(diphosphate) 3'-pyrophosphohydrolase
VVFVLNIKYLIDQVVAYYPQADIDLVRRAYAFAAKAHAGQWRLSGEEYIHHPLEVAKILAELQLDVVTIAAGLLHDVVEDTPVTREELAQYFNDEIALLVDGVTKLSRIEYKSKEEQQVENLRKMFLAMARDIRVILIKLADRLHNMRTLKYQPLAKQKEIAEETLEIFAPLAHRLGIFALKWQLEDWALRFLEPEKYYDLVERISMKRKERETYIQEVVQILKEKFEEAGIQADIQGRPKHFYSIYNKMVKKNKELSEIYDLIAVRVQVEDVKNCYGALGTIHTLWKPIPGRFKDYIAMPKPNMYQSLHTTVIGPQGEPFEIQIRTFEMHRTAEYGIAAHWRYKEKLVSGDSEFEEKLSWLRQLLDWQRDLRDAREFMESLKIDLFSDRVYVFTPKGDVVELPVGSCPLDFAYKVHTAVGHQCIGVRVNGKITPLDYALKTGDILEILTAKGGKPSRDWLKVVKTSQAKNRIRQWYKKEERDENIIKGKELFERELRKQGLPLDSFKTELLLEGAKRFNFLTVEDLYAALGDGGVTPLQVLSKLKESLPVLEETSVPPLSLIKPWKNTGDSSPGIKIKGAGNVMVRFSHCCNPLPNDPIIGYITRGRGVSIHHADCANINYYKEHERERVVEVSWEQGVDLVYQAQISAVAIDRPGLTMDIMMTITDTKTIVNAVHARATKNNLATVDLKIEIKNMEHLIYIIEKIRKIRDVLEVKRVTPS